MKSRQGLTGPCVLQRLLEQTSVNLCQVGGGWCCNGQSNLTNESHIMRYTTCNYTQIYLNIFSCKEEGSEFFCI